MTEKDKKLLGELNVRIKQLMYLCDTLKEENRFLKNELSQKNIEVETLSSEVRQLKTQYDNLLFAKSFSGDEKSELSVAKRRLSKLVQDVEKCIVLLKS